jgi:hypothetical protein
MSCNCQQDIECGRYNVVTINSEILMGNELVEELWKKADSQAAYLSFDIVMLKSCDTAKSLIEHLFLDAKVKCV